MVAHPLESEADHFVSFLGGNLGMKEKEERLCGGVVCSAYE